MCKYSRRTSFSAIANGPTLVTRRSKHAVYDPQFGMGKSKTRMLAWSTIIAKFVN